MKIINHFAAGIEIIEVSQKDKKVMVENQTYTPAGRYTKYHNKD